ncbi:Adenine phosphoribosyltransferase [Exaiptasia diaphana]|nr:Adenine phosphoribosyltransferase [Exaiptasia diaphana]
MAANEESICDQEKALAQVKQLIRTIPDFPKPGIMFKDICPILKDPSALRTVTDVITDHIKKNLGKIDVIAGKQMCS